MCLDLAVQVVQHRTTAQAQHLDQGRHPFHGAATHPAINQFLEVAMQVGPSHLTPLQRRLARGRPVVADDDAGDSIAQQGLLALEPPPRVDHEVARPLAATKTEPWPAHSLKNHPL
jgi:hypothetical protein